MSTYRFLGLVSVLTLTLVSGGAHAVTIDFDGITDLTELESLGLTFDGLSLWTDPSAEPKSVLIDPNGGAVSPPKGICCGAGSIFFASPVDDVSIFVFSGPENDPLTRIIHEV